MAISAGASPGPCSAGETYDPPALSRGCLADHLLYPDHERWSVYWDKQHGVWRVAEDDPDSDLYAESSDAATVISYIKAHA